MRNLICSVLIALATAGAAKAATYDFSYYANGGPSGEESGTGELTLGPAQGSDYQPILDISGEANGSPITGLSDYAGANNFIYDSGLFVDQGGISIGTAAGIDYNLFSYDGSYYVLSSTTTPYALQSNSSPLICLTFTPEVSAAPEPSTWLLLIVGVGVGGLILRRAKRATIAGSSAFAA